MGKIIQVPAPLHGDIDLVQFLMPHFGRRTLYLWGQLVMFVILIVIGGLGVPAISSSTGWATGALLLALTFTYGELLHARAHWQRSH